MVKSVDVTALDEPGGVFNFNIVWAENTAGPSADSKRVGKFTLQLETGQ